MAQLHLIQEHMFVPSYLTLYDLHFFGFQYEIK